jgi:hypothetical protein
LTIRAGTSNSAAPLGSDAEQDRTVTSFRIHPGYLWSGGASPDDVAVLALNAPLDLSGGAVQAVALPSASLAYPAGATVDTVGFGRESAGSSPNGSLNVLTATVDAQGECGGTNVVVPASDAITLCAASSTGAVCSGDSGAGVVLDSSHVLVGIVSASPVSCAPGTHGIFVYVGAPEITSFIQGNDHPAQAPRSGDTTTVKLVGYAPLQVGATLLCRTAGWIGDASFTYAFVNAATGAVLQSGAKASYVVPKSAVGTAFSCRAVASNGGGSALLTSVASEPVTLGAPPTIEKIATAQAAPGRSAAVTVTTEIPLGLHGVLTVCGVSPASVGKRVCVHQHLASGDSGAFPVRLSLRIAARATPGVKELVVTATVGDLGAPPRATRTARLRVTRG